MTAPTARLGRAIVTGAGGFIGQKLIAHLRTMKVEVAALGRADCDLRDLAAVKRIFNDIAPDTIFHLAATGQAGPAADSLATISDNAAMAENVARSAPSNSRVVIAGSMSEYGRSGRLREADCCTPHTGYGLAKLTAGQRATMVGQERGIEICNARLFGVFGPGEAPHRLFPAVLAALRAGRAIALSDGLQRRDFVHVGDVCQALTALAQAAECPPIINVGTGQALQVRAVIEHLADLCAAPRELLQFGVRQRSVHDEDIVEADVSLLATIIPPPPQRLIPPYKLALFN